MLLTECLSLEEVSVDNELRQAMVSRRQHQQQRQHHICAQMRVQ